MGAARVFGPQKGADPDTVIALERRLTEWAAELNAAAGREVSDEPGAGAAGGIGAGLLALGGRRASGATIIAEHTRLAGDVAAAELVITGEGRFDDQSLRGKVVSALAAEARGTPVLVLAGQIPWARPPCGGRASPPRTPSPTTPDRSSWPSTTRPTSWPDWPRSRPTNSGISA